MNATNDIVVSSRVRLARNIANLPFPQKLSSNMAFDIITHTAKALTDNFSLFYIKDMNSININSMVEKHLISPSLALNENAAVLIDNDESVSIMVNEEDHIRIQCIVDGLNLNSAYEKANNIDDILIEKLPIAFNDKYGFLTSCPTNIGTGLRASVMLFLPALTFSKNIYSIIETLNKVRITVRGIYGEGSKALGCLYQVSNQVSLGYTEKEIINTVTEAVETICSAEFLEREFQYKNATIELKDKIFRSYGVLTNAYKITTQEFMELFSYVKLGETLGLISLKDSAKLYKLLIRVQPNTLALEMSNNSIQERDIYRASVIKKALKQ